MSHVLRNILYIYIYIFKYNNHIHTSEATILPYQEYINA